MIAEFYTTNIAMHLASRNKFTCITLYSTLSKDESDPRCAYL
jgi:hypothetical protein